MASKFVVTDHRVREACEGLGVDIAAASPEQRLRAYCKWTGTVNLAEYDGAWGNIILDVAEGCGFARAKLHRMAR